jgi:hypothetical protein
MEEMRFYLNSGQTNAVKARRGLGGDAAALPKSPRDYKGSRREVLRKSYGSPTEVLRRYRGAPPGTLQGTAVQGPSVRNAF